MSKKFKEQHIDSTHPFTQVSLSKGEAGDDAIYCIPSRGNIPVPCDSNNANPVYTGAVSYLRVLRAGLIIADESTANGWSASVTAISNGTGSISGLTFTLESITDAVGYVDISISKSGENTLYARIYFFRIHKGVTGDQGIQGIQGIQGATGAAGAVGNDGDGVVIVKKKIRLIDAEQTGDVGDDSGSICYLNGHGFEVGENVEITNSIAYDYDGIYVVSEVVDVDSFRLEGLTYVSDGVVSFTNLSNIRNVNPRSGQSIYLTDIIPEKYKAFGIFIYCSSFDITAATPTVVLYAGTGLPNDHYNLIYSKYISYEGDQIDEDISSLSFFSDVLDSKKTFYLYLFIQSWTNRFDDFNDLELELNIACYNYAH
jgi:hypothetical protein